MMEKNLKNYVYVCSHCMNRITECTCIYYPETLIQLDRNIWPSIRELNRKLYWTTDCCEGHIGSNEAIHIFFRQKYKFKEGLPEGFTGDGRYIMASFTGNTELAKKRSKGRLLKNLYEWACALPELRPEGFHALEKKK